MIMSQKHIFSQGGNYLLGVAVAALFCAVSSAHAENNWTYYAKSAEGNPADVDCIVKGEWIVEKDIMTLNTGMFSPKKILGSASDGVLDFRDLCIDGTAITNLNIRQSNIWADSKVVEFYANHVSQFSEDGSEGSWRQCASYSGFPRQSIDTILHEEYNITKKMQLGLLPYGGESLKADHEYKRSCT